MIGKSGARKIKNRQKILKYEHENWMKMNIITSRSTANSLTDGIFSLVSKLSRSALVDMNVKEPGKTSDGFCKKLKLK